jgi:TonB family protein
MKRVPILIAMLIAATVVTAQNDPVQAARDLYASAAYEEALAELSRAGGSPRAPEAAREMDAYRAFCLVALGRTAEAEKIAESLVRKDPLFTLDRYPDASPRIAAMFTTVRTRVLPQLIRDEYRSARTLAAEKSPDANARLGRVQQLLDEAKKVGAWDDTLADLKLLVDGFLELSREPEPAAAPPSAAPAATTSNGTATTAPVVRAAAPVTMKEGDPGVAPPVAVSQPVPRVPPALYDLMKRLRRTGAIDVVIDERGSVEDVIVTQSVNSAYDTLIVAAARTWKYRPALKDGVPVRFVKTVAINIQEP